MTNTTLPEWIKDYTQSKPDTPRKEVFKLASGSKTITFDCNHPNKFHNEETGRNSLIFDIIVENKPMVFFVNAKSYDFIRSMFGMGFPLAGKSGVVSRTGKMKATRWSFTPLPEEEHA